MQPSGHSRQEELPQHGNLCQCLLDAQKKKPIEDKKKWQAEVCVLTN
jgi:hypothetical protein